jgi:hypothetical protein
LGGWVAILFFAPEGLFDPAALAFLQEFFTFVVLTKKCSIMNDELSFDQEVDYLKVQVEFILTQVLTLTEEQKAFLESEKKKILDSNKEGRPIDGGTF